MPLWLPLKRHLAGCPPSESPEKFRFWIISAVPSRFTLTRGVAMLNSSEVPRQHLMAGAVIATVPVMALFLGLEKFMTRGLTAGSVKG